MSESATQAKPVTHCEVIKAAIPTLAGNIMATIADANADHFSEDDYQFLKFHGCYQQDDRDLRKTGKKYIMMVRARIPGGVMTAAQWHMFDKLATQHGNNTLRITTRQSIQFHGILKSNLRNVIKGINDCLLSTISACGDVSRNVLAPPTPAHTKARDQVYRDCVLVADAVRPETKAYHAIWVDGVQLDLNSEENKTFVDPLFGPTYLPRKFKIAFAIPPSNDIDIFTNDVGFIAIIENEKLVGYNVAVGGGMGRSHGNEATFPRLADVLGFVTPDKVVAVSKAVITIHRDFGDRTDRKHARLKYVIEERGVEWARTELESRLGFKLHEARPYTFTTSTDLYDWHKDVDGKWFLTLFVETGRVKDVDGHQMKTALRQVAERFPKIEFRLTTNQNVILANVMDADKHAITALLHSHGLKTEKQRTLTHLAAMACPALPTCGLALAESERMLPGLVDRIEKLCEEVGIGGEEIIVRSTGCPNGCARPYMAEIAFVGKAPGRYQVWLGGNVPATRLNRIWKDVMKEADIEHEFRPVLIRFVKERHPGERFGDWCDRVFLKEQTN